jgi:16S rRNA (guanine1207-N2)-methyltransferase
MPHYYTPDPASEHDIKLIQATLRGLSLRFFTDSGVFSKDGVDYGTQALIAAMRIPAGAAVLDMGCGYGPLGIAAALLNPTGSVTFADINARALDLAAKNCAANGVTGARFVLSDGFGALERDKDKFDCILLNPPIRAGKEVVFRLYRGAAAHVKPSGSLWVVIQKKQGAPSTAKELALLFSAVHIRDRDKGYYVFEAEAEAEAKGTEPIASQPPN